MAKQKTIQDILAESMNLITDWDREYCFGAYLDKSLNLRGVDLLSIGITDSTLIEPKLLFREAIKHGASYVVLLHNHPSGDTTPSKADKKLTEQMRKAGSILGIEVIDHMIFCKDKYYSMHFDKTKKFKNR